MTSQRQIGKSILRLEDGPFLRGRGRYVDDIHMPGMLEAAFVRSSHAHAFIQRVDVVAARAMPGVHAVLTMADLRPFLKRERIPLHFPHPGLTDDVTPVVLADQEAVFVGEAIAVVIADSRYVAEDAAMLVDIAYEPLAAVADCKQAIAPNAPNCDTRHKSNILVEFRQQYGDPDRAFASAPHQLSFSLKQHRGGPHPIEGRGLVAFYDEFEDRLTVWSSTQHAHESQAFLMTLLGLHENQIRVAAPDIGGGFGAKFVLYPEEVVVAIASRLLRRPVKWIEDRHEQFLATIQERDQYWDIEIAFDHEARLLGARGRLIHDVGAYAPHGVGVAYSSSTAFPNVYNLPAYSLHVLAAKTNKVATAAVRGAGHPQAILAIEHALDRIARALDLDRAEVRRRNLIQPGQLPFERPIRARSGVPMILDSGDFPRCQQKALDAIDYAGFAERQRRARAEGRYIGLGVANGVKGTGRGPYEMARVGVGRSGKISVYTGAISIGQGVKTAFAQICAEQLGVEPNEISIVIGDTTTLPLSLGAFASRQTVMAGSAVHLAAAAVRDKTMRVAAHLLEAAVEDLEMRDGRVELKGVPGHNVSLQKIADALAGVPGYPIPGGFEPGLESNQTFMGDQLTFGMASHAVEVEVDIGTGQVRILRYVAVHDSGRQINPMMVTGQIVGGVVHGIGNALFEWMGYDENAQPITTTLAEYLLPSAPETPFIEVISDDHPSLTNPLGVKGVGESGAVPATAAIVSAVEDALKPFDVEIAEVPISPRHIIEHIRRGLV